MGRVERAVLTTTTKMKSLVMVMVIVMKMRLAVMWMLWRDAHIHVNRISWVGLVVVDLTMMVVLLRVSSYLQCLASIAYRLTESTPALKA